MYQTARHHRVEILGILLIIAVRADVDTMEAWFHQRVEEFSQLDPLPVARCFDHPTLRWTTSTKVNNLGSAAERSAAADAGTPYSQAGIVFDSEISASPRECIFVDTNVPARRYVYTMKYEPQEKALTVLGLERNNEVLGTRAGEKSELQISKADILALIGRSLQNVPDKERSLAQASRVREKYKDQRNKYVFGGRRAGASRGTGTLPRHTSPPPK
jgi:hypothetical protein